MAQSLLSKYDWLIDWLIKIQRLECYYFANHHKQTSSSTAMNSNGNLRKKILGSNCRCTTSRDVVPPDGSHVKPP